MSEIMKKIVAYIILFIYFSSNFGGAVLAIDFPWGEKNRFSSLAEFYQEIFKMNDKKVLELLNDTIVFVAGKGYVIIREKDEVTYKFNLLVMNREKTSEIELKSDGNFTGFVASVDGVVSYTSSDSNRIKLKINPVNRVVVSVYFTVSNGSEPKLDIESRDVKVVFFEDYDTFNKMLDILHELEVLLYLQDQVEQIEPDSALELKLKDIKSGDDKALDALAKLSQNQLLDLISGLVINTADRYKIYYDERTKNIFVEKDGKILAVAGIGLGFKFLESSTANIISSSGESKAITGAFSLSASSSEKITGAAVSTTGSFSFTDISKRIVDWFKGIFGMKRGEYKYVVEYYPLEKAVFEERPGAITALDKEKSVYGNKIIKEYDNSDDAIKFLGSKWKGDTDKVESLALIILDKDNGIVYIKDINPSITRMSTGIQKPDTFFEENLLSKNQIFIGDMHSHISSSFNTFDDAKGIIDRYEKGMYGKESIHVVYSNAKDEFRDFKTDYKTIKELYEQGMGEDFEIRSSLSKDEFEYAISSIKSSSISKTPEAVENNLRKIKTTDSLLEAQKIDKTLTQDQFTRIKNLADEEIEIAANELAYGKSLDDALLEAKKIGGVAATPTDIKYVGREARPLSESEELMNNANKQDVQRINEIEVSGKRIATSKAKKITDVPQESQKISNLNQRFRDASIEPLPKSKYPELFEGKVVEHDGKYWSLSELSGRQAVEVSTVEAGGKRIVAIGDIHGDYDNFIKILKDSKLVDDNLNWIGGKNDFLVQMGDLMDRGPKSKEVIELAQKLERQAMGLNPEVYKSNAIFLGGNHDRLNMMYAEGQYSADLVKTNGLDKTVDSFGGYDNYKKAFVLDGSDNIGGWLSKRDIAVKIDDYIFSHTLINDEWSKKGLKALNNEYQDALKNKYWNARILDAEGPLWARTYTESEVIKSLENLDADRMIIGHTPYSDIKTYFDGKLIVVDTGISKAYNNMPSYLDMGVTPKQISAIYPTRTQKFSIINPGQQPVVKRFLLPYSFEPKALTTTTFEDAKKIVGTTPSEGQRITIQSVAKDGTIKATMDKKVTGIGQDVSITARGDHSVIKLQDTGEEVLLTRKATYQFNPVKPSEVKEAIEFLSKADEGTALGVMKPSGEFVTLTRIGDEIQIMDEGFKDFIPISKLDEVAENVANLPATKLAGSATPEVLDVVRKIDNILPGSIGPGDIAAILAAGAFPKILDITTPDARRQWLYEIPENLLIEPTAIVATKAVATKLGASVATAGLAGTLILAPVVAAELTAEKAIDLYIQREYLKSKGIETPSTNVVSDAVSHFGDFVINTAGENMIENSPKFIELRENRIEGDWAKEINELTNGNKNWLENSVNDMISSGQTTKTENEFTFTQTNGLITVERAEPKEKITLTYDKDGKLVDFSKKEYLLKPKGRGYELQWVETDNYNDASYYIRYNAQEQTEGMKGIGSDAEGVRDIPVLDIPIIGGLFGTRKSLNHEDMDYLSDLSSDDMLNFADKIYNNNRLLYASKEDVLENLLNKKLEEKSNLIQEVTEFRTDIITRGGSRYYQDRLDKTQNQINNIWQALPDTYTEDGVTYKIDREKQTISVAHFEHEEEVFDIDPNRPDYFIGQNTVLRRADDGGITIMGEKYRVESFMLDGAAFNYNPYTKNYDYTSSLLTDENGNTYYEYSVFDPETNTMETITYTGQITSMAFGAKVYSQSSTTVTDYNTGTSVNTLSDGTKITYDDSKGISKTFMPDGTIIENNLRTGIRDITYTTGSEITTRRVYGDSGASVFTTKDGGEYFEYASKKIDLNSWYWKDNIDPSQIRYDPETGKAYMPYTKTQSDGNTGLTVENFKSYGGQEVIIAKREYEDTSFNRGYNYRGTDYEVCQGGRCFPAAEEYVNTLRKGAQPQPTSTAKTETPSTTLPPGILPQYGKPLTG